MLRQWSRGMVLALMAAVLLAAPDLVSPRNASRADVGEIPEPGGLVTPGDKTDQIRMKSEKVVFSVRPNDGTFPDYTAECYAHVTADFLMQNLTASAVTMTLFFPLHSTWDPAMFEAAEQFGDSQTRNVRVLVGGREATLTYQTLVAFGERQLLSAVFEAVFPASADTPIHVEYDVRGVNQPKSFLVSFRYTMQTGSHWAGTIGSGQVIFEFWQPVDSKSPFGYVSDFFQVADGRLEWDFAGLEPDALHDITVTFEPAALANWAKRPGYLKNVVASDPPPRVAGAGWLWPFAGSLGDLPDTSRPERGWIMQQGQNPVGEWIELVLDQPHTVMGLRLRTGVLVQVEDYETGNSRDVWDAYRRPKTVAIALSGAITQTVSLADTPAEWQVVSLPGSPTASIRLTFLDSYPGTGEADAYLGVGHIEFLGVDAGSAGGGQAGECSGPNLLRNGDFEQGFGGQGTALGWKAFSSGEGATYTFYVDPWSPAVYQGLHSQLVAISTYGIPSMADRTAGIYQDVTTLEPGAVYELSLAGLLREEAAHPDEDRNRYTVQWALAKGSLDWTQVAVWQDLPWDTYYLSAEPGTFSTYTTRLLGPGDSATLFIRARKKWATSGRELDVNLDAIALRRCGPLPTCEVWNLAHDLRPFPDQENPNRDSYGNQAVWHFLQGVIGQRDPSTYRLLPSFTTHAFGLQGLEQWTAYQEGPGDNTLPAIGINTTDVTQTYSTLAWPAHAVRVHPSDVPVVVGWQSPISGQVRVSGLVRDMDGNCGNGVLWTIDLGTTTLASGSLGNGEAQRFADSQGEARLESISVNEGESLYFMVDPNGEPGCDSTELDIRIESETCAARRTGG